MSRKSTLILFASLTAAGLGLSQGALATDAAAPAAATPPTPPAPPAPMAAPESPDDIIARMEERHQKMIEERERRYEELRKHASELGFEMPEMPPWEPGEMAGMPSPDYAPWVTPEERNALREKRWEETRARAAEHGVELPEMPPWKAAEERRKAMMERIEKYRETIDAMSEEQREAIEAVFGEFPEFPEMPEFGERPAWPGNAETGPGAMPAPGYGMGPGWQSGRPCPYHGKNCNHGHPGYGPMRVPQMMAPPAPASDAAAAPEAPAAN